MRLETALNHRRRFKTRIDDTLNHAKTGRLSYRQVLDRVNEQVYQDPAHKKVPRHVRDYLGGYLEARLHVFFVEHVTWVLPFEGENYQNWSSLPQKGKDWYMEGPTRQGMFVHKSDMKSRW